MNGEPPCVRSLAEAEVVIQSLWARLEALEPEVRDHSQRFDTLQTPWWKRVWFALNGWPWYNLNANRPRPRPWHRWMRP